MKILSVSPKGQITIPISERTRLKTDKYLLEVDGDMLILKPVEIKVLSFGKRAKREQKTDEFRDFSQLAISSFDFWNHSADDVYQRFYEYS